MAPLLSIVVGTRDRAEGYRAMLDSIRAHTGEVEWELLVEDVSDSPHYAKEEDRVRVFRRFPPDGHIKGYNRMFRQAQGEWVTWLNDDSIVMPGWAEQAIKWMQGHPLVSLGCLTWSDAGGPWHVAEWHEMPYANFGLLRRGLGDAVGWFDEVSTFYGGDNTLALRVILAGHAVEGVPGRHVSHGRFQDRHRPANESTQIQDLRAISAKYDSLWTKIKDIYAKKHAEFLKGC